MQDIRESDWKVLRGLTDVAMERFFVETLREAEEKLRDTGGDSRERFWRVHSMMLERRKEAAELFDNLSRSKAIIRLMMMRSRGLITDDEMKKFSPDLAARIDPLG
ncbi:MAG TPA: hypothetical protein VM008_18550 [Phycisphaerae bacterium]|nr:hypothetical protein [Phycisphaerae bacterium]